MIRFVLILSLLCAEFSNAAAQRIILAKQIVSQQNGNRNVKNSGNNQFLLSLGSSYSDTLLYDKTYMFSYDSIVSSNTDFYVNHLLIDSSANYLKHFLSARGNFTSPSFNKNTGKILFSGRYQGYVSPLNIRGHIFEEDSFYKATTSGGTTNAYLCELDTQFNFIKGVNVSSPGTVELKVIPYGSSYFVSGSFGSEIKWDGDSINTLSIDTFSRSFSMLALLDEDFNFMWKKHLFSINHDFDPQKFYTYKSATGLGDIIATYSGNLMLFSTFPDGLEYDTDTIVSTEGFFFGAQVFVLLIDSNGNYMKVSQFRKNLESEHLDAVSNNQGTNLHFVGYKKSFSYNGVNYPAGRYFVFYDDTLGVKRIMNNPFAQAITPATDGSFYWVGQVKQDATFGNFGIQASANEQKVVVAKISPEGEYLWVKAVNGGMQVNSITENNKRIAFTGRAYQHINYQNDTLIKLAPSPFITWGLVILEDQHVVGKHEVLEEGAFLNVFPNPSHDRTQLRWKFEKPVQIEILDVSGRKVFEYKNLAPESKLNLSLPSKGVYFVIARTEDTSISRKIVIQ